MKKSKWIPLTAISAISLLLSNCADVRKDLPTQTTATQIQFLETTTKQSTEIPAPLPTSSHTPDNTITPTSTPFMILTQTPDIRLTQGKENFLKFIIECEEPCFWGIVPYKTSLIEAQNILKQAGLLLQSTTQDHYFTSFRFKINLGADVVLRINNSLITGIRIMITGIDRPETNKTDWVGYSLDKIFKIYGVPTKIGVFIDHPHEPPFNTGKVFIDYTLFYESQNIIVDYSGGIIDDNNDFYRFCPGNVVPQTIRIWYGKNPEFALEPAHLLGIDTASSFTNENFVNLVLKNLQTACVDLIVSSFQN